MSIPLVYRECNYVYASQSKAFPNLIKIGKATDLDAELALLNMGCGPAPHEYVATAATFDNIRDERMVHAFFEAKRKEGGFFEVSVEEVSNFFAHHIVLQIEVEREQHRAEAVESVEMKRKRARREEQIFVMEMEERKLRIEERKWKMEDSKIRTQVFFQKESLNNVGRAGGLFDEFYERNFIDSMTKKEFEEHIKNLILCPQSFLTTTQGGAHCAEDSGSDEESD